LWATYPKAEEIARHSCMSSDLQPIGFMISILISFQKPRFDVAGLERVGKSQKMGYEMLSPSGEAAWKNLEFINQNHE